MGRRFAGAAALLVVLFAPAARADFFNARNVLIGDRAALLGGAFTAVADDGTATFYNPAGIAELESTTLSASADAYALYALQRHELFDANAKPLDLGLWRFDAVPTSVVVNIKPTDWLGMSGGAFTLDRFRLSGLAQLTSAAVPLTIGGQTRFYGTLTQHVKIEINSELFGGALAIKLPHGFSIGTNGFFHLVQMSSSLSTTLYNGPLDQATQQQENELISGGLILGLGLKWSSSFGLQLGFSYTTQTIPLKGSNDYLAVNVASGGGEQQVSGTNSGDWRAPHRFALGLAYKKGRYLLALDLIAYAGLDYPSAHQPFRADLEQDRHAEIPHYDASLGCELPLQPNLTMRLGVFTNSSSAPQRYIEERVQMYGASLGVVYVTQGLETTVGLVGEMGESGWQQENKLNPPVSWTRKQISLVLGGSHKVGE
jgi:hypothetical protein